MNKKIKCHNKQYIPKCNHHNRGVRPSSFEMHDSEQVFERLKLKNGNTFLDLGCGAGEYSLYAAKLVGKFGIVYALDIVEKILKELINEASQAGLNNIKTIVADVFKPFPIEDLSIDTCMLATVLHAENVLDKSSVLFNEIRRVLKPGGHLAIIECKKEVMLWGPPIELRIAPEELEKELLLYGFHRIDYMDLGLNYMLLFECRQDN